MVARVGRQCLGRCRARRFFLTRDITRRVTVMWPTARQTRTDAASRPDRESEAFGRRTLALDLSERNSRRPDGRDAIDVHAHAGGAGRTGPS